MFDFFTFRDFFLDTVKILIKEFLIYFCMSLLSSKFWTFFVLQVFFQVLLRRLKAKKQKMFLATSALVELSDVGGLNYKNWHKERLSQFYTVPTHNSDTLFALTEMSLFWGKEDFAKKIHWFSVKIEPKCRTW